MGAKAGSKGTQPGGKAESDTSARDGECPASRSEADLARDWITLWQSELNAFASDPETLRSWRSTIQAWSGFAAWILQMMPKISPKPFDDVQTQCPTPKRQEGPAPAAAPPDPRDNEIVRLSEHIAQLERRMVNLERRLGGRAAVDPKRRRRRNV
ncbi:MAG TPA: hypothetical protein VFG62_20845 [Rhodopila sp.]|nr:hypothetical protein [Rhodopila sp.]